MKAANRDFTRELNLFNILNSIREAGSISRVEIAEKTGQSRASVTNITALLIEQGLMLRRICSLLLLCLICEPLDNLGLGVEIRVGRLVETAAGCNAF